MLRVTGGKHKGRRLRAPKGDGTRPTTEGNREALFNILDISLQHSMTRVLDLFAGTGALAIEAISRGAESAVLIDSSREAQKVITQNIREVEPGLPFRLLTESRPEQWAKSLREVGEPFLPFDTVFCDPPYGKTLTQKVFDHLLPASDLWADGALFLFECSKKESICIPDEFEVLKDRVRGDSRFLILQKAGISP